MEKKHICGVCEGSFDTEVLYVAHTCVTGFTPKDVEHQDVLTDGAFSKQAEKALERGEAKKSK